MTWTKRFAALLVCLTVVGLSVFASADGEDVKNALSDDQVGGKWIYDDIDAGFAKAKETGKPLLFVFR